MRTKMIYSSNESGSSYGASHKTIERYEYKCLCGLGKIVEEHDNIPGFREHDVYIDCIKCQNEYEIDKSKGVRCWEIVPKKKDVQ